MRLLRGEEQLSKDYLELSKLISRSPEVPSTISSISPNSAGEMSVTQTTGGSDSPLYLPSPDTEAPNVRVPIPYHLSHGLNKETADRLQVLAGHLEKFLLDRHTSNSLIEEYVSCVLLVGNQNTSSTEMLSSFYSTCAFP